MSNDLETLKKRLAPQLPMLSQLGHDVIKTYPPELVQPELAAKILIPVPMPLVLMLIAVALGTVSPEEPKDVTPGATPS